MFPKYIKDWYLFQSMLWIVYDEDILKGFIFIFILPDTKQTLHSIFFNL